MKVKIIKNCRAGLDEKGQPIYCEAGATVDLPPDKVKALIIAGKAEEVKAVAAKSKTKK